MNYSEVATLVADTMGGTAGRRAALTTRQRSVDCQITTTNPDGLVLVTAPGTVLIQGQAQPELDPAKVKTLAVLGGQLQRAEILPVALALVGEGFDAGR